MIPADAIYVELVKFFLSVLQKSSIVLAVIMGRCFIFDTIICINLFCTLRCKCSLNADTRLKKQQNEVEAMNFELFEVCAAEMPLVHILLHEIVLHVYSLQKFNRRNLFSLVDFLVINE